MKRSHLLFFLTLTLFLTKIVVAQAPPPPPAKKIVTPSEPDPKNIQTPRPPGAKAKGKAPKGVPRGIPGGIVDPPREAPIKWETFTSPDESFSLLMPKPPQSQQQSIDSPAGKIPGTTYLSVQAITGYAVTYADAPSEIDAPEYAKTALDATRDRLITQSKGKLLREKDMSYGDYPGRELKIETARITATNRYYYVKNRIYIVQVIVPTGMGDPDEYGQKFFDSFKVRKTTTKNLFSEAEVEKSATPPEGFFDTPIDWHEYSYTDAGFSALFPRQPFRFSAPINPADPRLIEHVVMSKSEGGVQLVSYQDFVGDVDTPEMRKMIFAGTRSLIEGIMKKQMIKITAEKDFDFAGTVGKEFMLESAPGLAKVSGSSRTILVGRRAYSWFEFHAENVTNNEDAKKFIASFKLLPREKFTTDKSAPPPPAPKAFPVPTMMRVSGGVLQDNARKKVQPDYPPDAIAARAQGAVQVAITVSEKGDVLTAEAMNGDRLLREAAVTAAKQWKFKITELSGTPVKVQGILTFNFTLQ